MNKEIGPLLQQALGETDPETPQLVQEILNRFESGNEWIKLYLGLKKSFEDFRTYPTQPCWDFFYSGKT
jgi:hypothetical protein